MEKSKSNFIIENYGQKSTFASFLPGIAGVRGVPIWSFYVNRGQGILDDSAEVFMIEAGMFWIWKVMN